MKNKTKLRHIIISVLVMILVIIAGTFAWLSFRSKDTAMVLTVGQIDNVRITLSPYQIKSNMGSVLDYSSGTVTNIEAINNSSSSKKFKLYYKINTIDSNLAISSFKYTITRSSTKNGTYTTYGTEGNFNGAISNSEKVILEETLASNETYYYKVYIWLDGNNDVSSASGKVFNAELRADILGHTVTFDANGGTVNISSKEVTTGLQYGELPTPTRKGYKFLGWNGKNLIWMKDLTNVSATNQIYNCSNQTFQKTITNPVYITNLIAVTAFPTAVYSEQLQSGKTYIWKFNNANLLSTGHYIILTYEDETTQNWYENTPITLTQNATITAMKQAAYTYSINQTESFQIQVEESTEATMWEPYFVTSDTVVTQDQDHTLTAIWEEANPVVTLNANGGTIPATTGWTGSGSTATKQVEYNGTYGTLPMPTRSGYTFLGWHGKNLLNTEVEEGTPSSTASSNTTSRTFTANTYVKGLAFNNYYSVSSVNSLEVSKNLIQLSARSGYGVAFPLLSSQNKQYMLSFNTNGTDNRGYSVLYYKSDGTFISYSNSGMLSNYITKNFTTPNNTYYLVIEFYGSNIDTNISITNIQLEEGTTATPYEPYYISSNTTVVQENNHTLTAMWQAN